MKFITSDDSSPKSLPSHNYSSDISSQFCEFVSDDFSTVLRSLRTIPIREWFGEESITGLATVLREIVRGPIQRCDISCKTRNCLCEQLAWNYLCVVLSRRGLNKIFLYFYKIITLNRKAKFL